MSLAIKYRPTILDEIVGQQHLLSKESAFRILVEKNAITHSFFYGPTGCGKTTLAKVIAKTLKRPFYNLNATTLKVEELRKIFNSYANALEKPIIFIDEIHRLSKNQQEVLLPFMENNSALIIGASTENPYYSLTSAIRSRSHLFELKAIKDEDLDTLLSRIMLTERLEFDKDIREFLISSSSGDARAMLNLLDSAIALGDSISLDKLKSIRPLATQQGSSEAVSHYDLTSAMIKSIRGSNIDAGLYYLARLINGGEPPEFIARRLTILASEDIGNANPPALNLASSTLNIVKHIGYPEARIPLAQLVVYLASSPKSNSSYRAINSALDAVKNGEIHPIPPHIKTHSKEYLNPHNFGGWIAQNYLTKELKFYESSN
ncbi:MAG: replication-associated recombination protein A, partial [Epsilonproteobacteria bacterium]|nr:replication-associated recombination protein A [Campylobacterota bacterium]